MRLHARETGTGDPIVLLHGLFGSNDNLGGLARSLADDFRVIGMDLRNHGQSPHDRRMDHSSMANDVNETMASMDIDRTAVVGHSLGGKVAMELALSRPEKVSRLAVLDIAPITYGRCHDGELAALYALDPATIYSRQQADSELAASITDPAIRQFLLKNLQRTEAGFRWRIPIETIYGQYDGIAAAPASVGPYRAPALFLRGENSDYIPKASYSEILKRFPDASITTIEGTGHWLHIDSKEEVLGYIRPFLGRGIPASSP